MARNALGRGLNALIREPDPPVPLSSTALHPTPSPSGPQEIDVDLIDPNPYQPRSRFREQGLEELAQSIRTSGIIQPLVVRPFGNRFQLIAGERRWRAAQRAGLTRVPGIVRRIPEEKALEITLVENIQREDLNPVEQARAFERLMVEFNLTQEDVAQRTGKDRTTVANVVRLLKLETQILDMIEDGRLSAGHGRALLAVSDPQQRAALARRAARGGLTVRQVERLAARPSPPAVSAATPLDANTRDALEELQRRLGTRVTLRPPRKGHAGHLSIEYHDETQLLELYDRLMK